MLVALTALFALLGLVGPFGEAAVEGTPSGDRLRVQFEIEVGGDPAAVVVHVVDPGQTQDTFSLARRGGDLWTGFADLDTINYVVVFEVLYPSGEGAVSDPATLMSLGLDPALLGLEEVVPVDEEDIPLTATTRRWGWGALALAAVALALLAVWALGERERSTPDEEIQPPS